MMSLSKRQKKRSKQPSLFSKSLFSLTLVAIFIGFGFVIFRVCSERQAEFEAKLVELDQVNEQLSDLDFHNTQLAERVELLKTDSGIEEVAREKLGLVKKGELAYAVVPPPPPQFIASDDLRLKYGEQVVKEVNKDRGTVIRLLRHFFGTEPESTEA